MLFEHRCYTLKLGCAQEFWQLQLQRGFEPVQPILDRLVGYFEGISGATAQITHLYRYDSYADWESRLHGLYGNAALGHYFTAVRAIMTAQENRFLALAPVALLNPLWGDGHDWLPGDADRGTSDLHLTPDALVEETVTQLVPGGLPAYWNAYVQSSLERGDLTLQNLVGCFYCMVGRLHQVVHYRKFRDLEHRQRYLKTLAGDPKRIAFIRAVRELVLSEESKLLRPSKLAALSPLFGRRG